MRRPEQLRLHNALGEIGFTVVDQLNSAATQTSQPVLEPVLVTTKGTIIAGIGCWRLAVLEGREEIHCIEYSIGEDEALQFLLTHHRPLRALNAFVRIRLALTQEAYFQQRAVENMRLGGKYKGSAGLPEARHIEVRESIAMLAGVGPRNVSNVKTIMKLAHPRLIEALQSGSLSINSVIALCRLPRSEQLERFIL